ncbi:unnamed protein product [Dicrocoelium dendriticum]|nr:unnamed protein product [Dicrocoelium dendriticum]
MFCPVMLRIMTSVNDRDSALSTNSQVIESVLNIRILIQDINDNAPTWPGHLKRFQVTFRDGDSVGERRTLPLAADSDVGTNAQLRYELVPPKDVDRGFSPFGLVEHPVDGLYIQALKNVDREERETYQFVLQAIDRANGAVDQQGGGSERQLTSRLIIDVLIVDINDNAPLFTQPVFTPNGPVAETTPVGRTVLVLNATDADTGINGAFHFAFSREHAWITSEVFARQYFDVRPNGQVVVRRPLNVDQMHTTADPALLTRANAVRLPNEEGLLTMNHIMPSVGQPRGPTMQFRFRVMVEDEAMRPYTRSSEATVIITVTDENDEAPIIDIRVGKDQNFTPLTTSAVEHFRFRHLTVSENQPVGTKRAFDPDFGGTDHVDCYLKTPNFTLTQSNPVTRTAVDSGNGLMTYLLKTAAELDRESTHSQLVALYCADLDGHMTEQNLTIHISDTNDNSPQFQRHEYVMQVEENMPPGTHLRHAGRFQDYTNRTQHSVLATDRDAGQNAELYYILSESGRNSSYFLIDSHSGALSTAVMLNREENAQFVLQVTAVDRGNPPRTGTTTVKVNIIDKNDNVPQFTQHAYTFHVMENRPGTESVGQVSATDQDSEAHGSIHYYLSNDPDAFVFRIELMTGILRTRQPLDREKQAKFQFLVFARDGNVPEVSSGPGSMGPMQLTGTATVTVVVDDENDNWPIFISPNATANTLAIAVDETLGHKLAYIQATDADEGENALISYQIRSGNTNSLFGLDKSTGLLYLASAPNPIVEANHLELERNNSVVMSLSEGGVKPDAIKPSVHTLTLEACDNGQQPRPKCTLFKNLRVFIKTLRDGELDNSERVRNVAQAQSDGENGRTSFSGNQLPSMSTHYNEVGVVDNAMMYGQTVAGARYTMNEIIIVCLSALFIIVLLITLLLVCLIRRRSIGNSSQNKAMDGARRTHQSTCHLHPLLTSLNCASLSTKVQLGSGRLSECRSPHRNSSQTANDANGAMDSICPFRECTPAENELFSVNTFSDSRYTLLPRDTDAGAQRQLSMAIGEPTNLPAFEQSVS